MEVTQLHFFTRGFPKSCCTSPNHVVCHGVPTSKYLNEGDIINVDVTTMVDGWHGDTSRMFFCRGSFNEMQKLSFSYI